MPSIVPLPDDRIMEIQDRIVNLHAAVLAGKRKENLKKLEVVFIESVVKQLKIEGPQAPWFVAGVVVGSILMRGEIYAALGSLLEKAASLGERLDE